MATEIEGKFRVASAEDFVRLRDKLREIGAIQKGVVSESNILFDRPDGSLSQQGCTLRVRTTVKHRLAGPINVVTLTFKGPPQEGAEFKSREEIELGIDCRLKTLVSALDNNAESVIQLLKALGYVERVQYLKQRESWDWQCKIELDSLSIGNFVEIEGRPEDIETARQELGLTELVKESYPELVERASAGSQSAGS